MWRRHLSLLLCLTLLTGATFTWTNPTTRTDGSPLTNLAGNRLYSSTASGGPYTLYADLSPAVETHEAPDADVQGKFWVATAYDGDNFESPFSNEATLGGSPPPQAGGLFVQLSPLGEPVMGLNVDLRVLTQPGATGNQTISLAADFDPKVIILWSSGLAAAGIGDTAQFGLGFGTYRGSVVQQRTDSVVAVHAAANADTASDFANDALLTLPSFGAPPTRDLEIDLVSMQSGATSEVVINWVNLHTTASIKVNCLILGGSDISDALVFDFTNTTSVASQDVTVASGFGQPDLLMVLGNAAASFATITKASLSLGFGKKGEAGRQMTYGSRDNNTVMFVGMSQRSNLLARELEPGNPFTNEGAYSLNTDPATNWPTDGFQIDYETQATVANIQAVLALRGTFTATTGNGTAPITGTLPVTQNLDHGSAPKVAFLFGWNLVAGTAVDESAADLGAFFVGAGDGTTELLSGLTDDDGLGTSDTSKVWTDTKVVRNYNAAATLQSEADGQISGNNFRLSWNDIDTVARQYQWLTLGDAAAGAANPTRPIWPIAVSP